MNRYLFCIQCAAFCGAVAVLSSCATPQAGLSGQAAGRGGGTAQAGSDYTFGPDDVVQVRVEGHPEWSGEFTIHPDGMIRMDTLGAIPVQGLNEERLQALLTERMSAYIRDPQVTVTPTKYISQVIYVLGEVNRPGEYSTAGKRVTLKDAVVMAGLPGRFAVESRVYIITPARTRPRQRVIDLYRILYRGETENNVVLQPGDIIYVPKSIFGKIAEFFSSILSPITTTTSASTIVTP